MALTYYERKAALPYGAVQDVADEIRAKRGTCAKSTVSEALKDGGDREIEAALARRMRHPETGARITVAAAFGPPRRTRRRRLAEVAV